MTVLGIDHYNLKADPALMQQLRDFYVDVVGLREGPRPAFAFAGFWLYAGEQAVLHLAESAAGDRRATDLRGTFDHVAFRCADWPAFEARLAARGLPWRSARVPGDGRLQVFLRDPAGNGVELQFPPGQD